VGGGPDNRQKGSPRRPRARFTCHSQGFCRSYVRSTEANLRCTKLSGPCSSSSSNEKDKESCSCCHVRTRLLRHETTAAGPPPVPIPDPYNKTKPRHSAFGDTSNDVIAPSPLRRVCPVHHPPKKAFQFIFFFTHSAGGAHRDRSSALSVSRRKVGRLNYWLFRRPRLGRVARVAGHGDSTPTGLLFYSSYSCVDKTGSISLLSSPLWCTSTYAIICASLQSTQKCAALGNLKRVTVCCLCLLLRHRLRSTSFMSHDKSLATTPSRSSTHHHVHDGHIERAHICHACALLPLNLNCNLETDRPSGTRLEFLLITLV
jgi:hypothetical protein